MEAGRLSVRPLAAPSFSFGIGGNPVLLFMDYVLSLQDPPLSPLHSQAERKGAPESFASEEFEPSREVLKDFRLQQEKSPSASKRQSSVPELREGAVEGAKIPESPQELIELYRTAQKKSEESPRILPRLRDYPAQAPFLKEMVRLADIERLEPANRRLLQQTIGQDHPTSQTPRVPTAHRILHARDALAASIPVLKPPPLYNLPWAALPKPPYLRQELRQTIGTILTHTLLQPQKNLTRSVSEPSAQKKELAHRLLQRLLQFQQTSSEMPPITLNLPILTFLGNLYSTVEEIHLTYGERPETDLPQMVQRYQTLGNRLLQVAQRLPQARPEAETILQELQREMARHIVPPRKEQLAQLLSSSYLQTVLGALTATILFLLAPTMPSGGSELLAWAYGLAAFPRAPAQSPEVPFPFLQELKRAKQVARRELFTDLLILTEAQAELLGTQWRWNFFTFQAPAETKQIRVEPSGSKVSIALAPVPTPRPEVEPAFDARAIFQNSRALSREQSWDFSPQSLTIRLNSEGLYEIRLEESPLNYHVFALEGQFLRGGRVEKDLRSALNSLEAAP
ncbi:MAG: hypothetical protein HY402_05855 [Elusimicrobia bacterium]|nr:hypothetical protein [Elusimicrobiota bacterium]